VKFTPESHLQFATMSGDFNPLHMDAVAARRTQAGAPVVHGVHTLLWLLDYVAGQQPAIPAATTLKAQFRRMLYVGEFAAAEIVQLTATALRARVLVDGVEVLSLILGFGLSPQVPQRATLSGAASVAPPSIPVDLSLEQMEGRSGRLRFATPAAAAGGLFPHAAAYLGAQRVAALACTSCLVGMVVPGLHSMFGGLNLRIDEDDAADELQYAVTSVDARFGLVIVAVQGAGISGTLSCMNRPRPVVQPAIAAIAPTVVSGEFLGTVALIAGGSRGLGEVTAKLIAAGGGRVTITYQSGQADAEAVAREITDWGGQCDTLAYDARQGAAAQLALLRVVPTHVYYFATPRIGRRKQGLCDPHRLEEFNTFYLTGFYALVEACLRIRPAGIDVFYPSTVYVDSRPAELTEYAMVKAAGEILCADMQKYLRGVRILARRLPRLATDQTGSFLPGDAADPVAVMLPIVRELQRRETAKL
jgi:hypothetical protein